MPTKKSKQRLNSEEIYVRQRNYSIGPGTPGSPEFPRAPPSTPQSHGTAYYANSNTDSAFPRSDADVSVGLWEREGNWSSPAQWRKRTWAFLAILTIGSIIRLGSESDPSSTASTSIDGLTTPNPSFRARDVFGSPDPVSLPSQQHQQNSIFVRGAGWIFAVWIVVILTYALLSLCFGEGLDYDVHEQEFGGVQWEDVNLGQGEDVGVGLGLGLGVGSHGLSEGNGDEKEIGEKEAKGIEKKVIGARKWNCKQGRKNAERGQKKWYHGQEREDAYVQYDEKEEIVSLSLNNNEDEDEEDEEEIEEDEEEVKEAQHRQLLNEPYIPARKLTSQSQKPGGAVIGAAGRDFTYNPSQGIAFQSHRPGAKETGAMIVRGAGGAVEGPVGRAMGRDYTFNPAQEIKIAGVGAAGRGPLPGLKGRDGRVV